MQPDELAQPAPVPSTSRGNHTTRDHEEQTTQSIGAVAQPQVSVPVANSLDPANANSTTGTSIGQPNLIQKGSDQLGYNVSPSLKQKIVSGQFIDLSLP